MTATPRNPQQLDAWAQQELRRMRQENRIRMVLVVGGLAALITGFCIATYLMYNEESNSRARETAPITGEELAPLS